MVLEHVILGVVGGEAVMGESSVGSSDGTALLLGSGGGCCGCDGSTVVQVAVGVVLESTEAVDGEMGAGGGGRVVDAGGPRAVVRSGSEVEAVRRKNHVRRGSAVHEAGSHA